MTYDFRWNDWNLEHVAKHDVSPAEAQSIVEHPQAGYPEKVGNEKYRVRGQTSAGRYLQVVYFFDPDDAVYIVHARELTDREKRQLRRRRS